MITISKVPYRFNDLASPKHKADERHNLMTPYSFRWEMNFLDSITDGHSNILLRHDNFGVGFGSYLQLRELSGRRSS